MMYCAGSSRLGHSKTNSATQLDDIFARLEPPEASDGLGRIDDDPASPLTSLTYKPALPADSPRSAWNRVWR